MNLKTIGILALGFGGVYGFQQTDKALNYIETTATVDTIKYECTVENYKGDHLEHKSTGKKAYMDCDLAKLAAAQHGFKESDIDLHANLEYSWTSPADGSTQHKTHRTRVDNREEYSRGKTFNIYAHKEDASKSYFK